MSFKTDKQTLDDLMIFGRQNAKSIFELFNRTHSRGGARILNEMFRNPLSECESIVNRSQTISFFKEHLIDYPFRAEMFDAVEFYLEYNDVRTQLTNEHNNLQRKLQTMIGSDLEFAWINHGILGCLELLNNTKGFLAELSKNNFPDREQIISNIGELLNSPIWCNYSDCQGKKKIPMSELIEFDRIFRFEHRDKLLRMLSYLFQLDVYISVADVAREQRFSFAEAHDEEELSLRLKGVYHPLVPGAVANDLEMRNGTNIIFLTGANMAGKSTMMKTLSIALFLAHMGFPVPAQEMEFSVRNGMFTTINLPDNLSCGYSHFYSEVLRVKKVGESLHNTRKLIVIFDELFRGTNVKDAYDATLAVVEAFAQNKDSLFVISTHITEVGQALEKQCSNIRYLYLPTKMEGAKPVYPYKLAEGITADRHGMVIVNNEKIVEIINGEYHDF